MNEHEIRVYFENDLICRIRYSFKPRKLTAENLGGNKFQRPFGDREGELPFWQLDDFIESRVFPETRANCKDLLKELGLEHFDAWAIARKTHGIMTHDYMWLEFDEERLDYDRDIKHRIIRQKY